MEVTVIYTYIYIYVSIDDDKNVKRTRGNFGKKRNPNGFIYLPGSKFRQAESNKNWDHVYMVILLIQHQVLENSST